MVIATPFYQVYRICNENKPCSGSWKRARYSTAQFEPDPRKAKYNPCRTNAARHKRHDSAVGEGDLTIIYDNQNNDQTYHLATVNAIYPYVFICSEPICPLTSFLEKNILLHYNHLHTHWVTNWWIYSMTDELIHFPKHAHRKTPLEIPRMGIVCYMTKIPVSLENKSRVYACTKFIESSTSWLPTLKLLDNQNAEHWK